jgi:hypothetical protein
MLHLGSRQIISDKISKYIKDSTNKSLEKYKNNVKNYIPYKNDSSDFFMLLPFVSLISFLAGYKLSKTLQN